MNVSIVKRMTLEEVCYTFFGNKELVDCIKGKYTPKSWFWQKHFKIKEYGSFLTYLLFNGVFDKESEKIMFEFFMKYRGRIIDRDIKFRKCIVRRIEEYGFESGIMYTMLASFTSKQLFIKHSPKCCRLLTFIIPDFRFGVNMSLKCAYLNEILNIYFQLEKETNNAIYIQDNDVSDILRVIVNGDVYSIVLPFIDKIVATSLLRICIAQWKIPSTIDKVRNTLHKYLEISNLQKEKVTLIKDKFEEGVKLIMDNYYTTFKVQDSQKKCLEFLNTLEK